MVFVYKVLILLWAAVTASADLSSIELISDYSRLRRKGRGLSRRGEDRLLDTASKKSRSKGPKGSKSSKGGSCSQQFSEPIDECLATLHPIQASLCSKCTEVTLSVLSSCIDLNLQVCVKFKLCPCGACSDLIREFFSCNFEDSHLDCDPMTCENFDPPCLNEVDPNDISNITESCVADVPSDIIDVITAP